MATTPRPVRVPDELWQAALGKARSQGTTLTAVVLAALRAYVDEDITPPPA